MATDSTQTPAPDAAPWSLRPKGLGRRGVLTLGAGAVLASFYIGTGDIVVATKMGALYRYQLWWTYFVLAIAGWALVDMSVRYFLQTGRTPMSAFKEVHWAVAGYMYLAVVVCTILGSCSQWNACAMVVSGLVPSAPIELGGALAALLAVVFIAAGGYQRIERIFVWGLVALVVCFFASAVIAGARWGEAAIGLIPHIPRHPPDKWQGLFRSNAGSIINAWLILIYPYTMIEKRWFSRDLQTRVDYMHRARIDYAWGILAAGVVALPIMAAAAAVANPFGFVPKGYMDFSILLEPLAGAMCKHLFLAGLFLAAWTAGVGWWVCGTYALLDMLNLPIKMTSRPMRVGVVLFLIPSVALLFLRINPATQILFFAGFLAVVFPVMALALFWRVTRSDMGYFRAWRHNWVLLAADVFALLVSVYVGWGLLWSKFIGPVWRKAFG